MADNQQVFQEVIRLAFETGGTEGVKQAAAVLAQLGDVSEEVKQQAAGLFEDITGAERGAKVLDSYRQAGSAALQYGRDLAAAQQRAAELAQAIRDSEAPTKAQQRDLERVRATISDLSAAQQTQLAKVRDAKAQLDAQGVSLRSVSAAQRDLAANTQAAGDKLRALVTQLQQQRAAVEAEAQAQVKAQQEAAEAEQAALAAAEAAQRKHQQTLENGRALAQKYAAELQSAFGEAAESIKQAGGASKGASAGSQTAGDLDKATAALNRFVDASRAELKQLADINAELARSGASTQELITGQALLTRRTREVAQQTQALTVELELAREAELSYQRDTAAAAERAADARRAQARELEQEADRKRRLLKEEADAYDRAAAQIKRNATAARQGAAETSASLEQTRGVVDRLKGALAGLVAFFSFDALLRGIKGILSTGDEFAKFEKQLSSLYGSAAKGEVAFEWVKAFTKTTPLQLSQVMESFITLKNFGIDPTAGALQAVVDQNAKLGGESERLQRITLALGQAFAKQKFQAEEMLQLVEAGVPVYQILGEVTGKTAAELQQLGAAGKLGVDVLQKFVAQMGKDSFGAAADQAALLSGQVNILTDNLQQFADRIAKGGFLTYVRDQFRALNEQIAAMAKDGRLDRYAQQISDALIKAAKAVQSFTGYLWDHAAAIGAIVKAYATFKVARVVGELALTAGKFFELTSAARGAEAAMGTAGTRAGWLGRMLGKIPGNIQVAIAVVGFDLLVKAGNYIGELAGKHSQAAKDLEATQQRINQQLRSQAEAYMAVEERYAQFANTQVLTAKQVAQQTEGERAAYQARLEGMLAYLKAKQSEQLRLVQLNELSQEELSQTTAAYRAAKDGLAALAEGAAIAGQAAKDKLSAGAIVARDALQGIATDATTAQTRIETLFQSFQTDSVTHIGDIGLALANVADQSQKADIAVRVGLQGTLNQLSSTDLLKFQSAATAAFQQFQVGAQGAAAVTESVLQVALQRLGVAADQWGLKTTDATRQNVAAFAVVAENAAATAGTIEAAFNKALAAASSTDEVEQLGAAMQAAGQQGKVSFDATERALAAVQNRTRSLTTAMDPLNASFEALGIKSKRALDDAAAAAQSAYQQIVNAQRQGKASIDDVRAAFLAYAKAQTDAVANSDAWKQQQVQSALDVQASIIDVSDQLDRMGGSGAAAGDAVSSGANRASSALEGTANAADDAATAIGRVGRAHGSAADAIDRNNASTDDWITRARAVAGLGGLADRFVHDLMSLNRIAASPNAWRTAWNATVAEWQSQVDEVNKLSQSLEKQNAQYDDMSKRMDQLRQRFKYLRDDQLAVLAGQEAELARNKQQAADEEQRAKDAAAQAKKDKADQAAQQNAADSQRWAQESAAASPAAGGGTDSGRIALDLTLKQEQGGQTINLPPSQLRDLANMAADQVVRRLSVAKARSNR